MKKPCVVQFGAMQFSFIFMDVLTFICFRLTINLKKKKDDFTSFPSCKLYAAAYLIQPVLFLFLALCVDFLNKHAYNAINCGLVFTFISAVDWRLSLRFLD